MGSRVASEMDMVNLPWSNEAVAEQKKTNKYDLLNTALCDNYVRKLKTLALHDQTRVSPKRLNFSLSHLYFISIKMFFFGRAIFFLYSSNIAICCSFSRATFRQQQQQQQKITQLGWKHFFPKLFFSMHFCFRDGY